MADLGISEERAETPAGQAGTIGTFLKLLRVEKRRNREILANKLEAQEQWRLKGLRADVVILNEHEAGYRNEMQGELTRLVELLSVNPRNQLTVTRLGFGDWLVTLTTVADRIGTPVWDLMNVTR